MSARGSALADSATVEMRETIDGESTIIRCKIGVIRDDAVLLIVPDTGVPFDDEGTYCVTVDLSTGRCFDNLFLEKNEDEVNADLEVMGLDSLRRIAAVTDRRAKFIVIQGGAP